MGGAAAAAGGHEKAYRDYIAGNMLGIPEGLEEHHHVRKEMVGDYEMLANFRFGRLPYELVYGQLKLFADKVMPDLEESAVVRCPSPVADPVEVFQRRMLHCLGVVEFRA
jgi:hypothetical protein